MSSQQHNPNLHHDTTVYSIGKGASWLVAIVFITMLILPPLFEHLRPREVAVEGKAPLVELFTSKGRNEALIDHLHKVERKLDNAKYSTELRQGMQEVLTSNFYRGNRKVFIGFDGWLYYQPDLKALTGFGPLKPEPFSVMKDPELAKLPQTRDVVEGFAKQLEERGIKLLLVPLPLKPMIYPEYVNPKIQREWISHPDAPAFYNELRKAGIDVLDLTEPLAKLRSQRRYVFIRDPDPRDKKAVEQAREDAKKLKETFLQQDTHWTPEAMRDAAEMVAEHIRKQYPDALKPTHKEIRAQDGIYRHSLGDLVKLLDLKEPETLFDKEEAFLRVITDTTEDSDSTITLLGDSFVNIYDLPGLGFDDPEVEDDGEPRMRAGFAQHLALYLRQPLDVIAINGAGATGVRKQFAQRYDDEVRSKKLVVWVIASRDLLLSRTAAHQANITWEHVEFNPNRKPESMKVAQTPTAPPSSTETSMPQQDPNLAKVVVEAVLTEKTPNQDPVGTPYTDALHVALYEVENVVEGSLEAPKIAGVQWTFRNKVMQPTSNFVEGKRYRLTLVPVDARPELKGLNTEDETSAFLEDIPKWFVEKGEEIK